MHFPIMPCSQSGTCFATQAFRTVASTKCKIEDALLKVQLSGMFRVLLQERRAEKSGSDKKVR